MNSITLVSLALLKARFEVERRDIVDAFVCFAEMCVARRQPAMFSPEEMKGWLLSDFGLDLPLPPVKLVVGRMVKRGIARRHDKIYIINQISCDPEAFDKNQAEMVSHYRAVRLGLQEFARDALGKELTEAECESGLLNYIDEYSIECVSSFRYGDAVPIRGRNPGNWRFIV